MPKQEQVESNVVPMPRDDKSLATELKERHGVAEVHLLTADGGARIFVRAPKDGEWRRFRSQIQSERTKADAGENLLRAVLLWPELPAFEALISKKPGLVDIFSAAVVELAGMSGPAEKKVF